MAKTCAYMYTQAQVCRDRSFQDFATIEKFLCIQIFPLRAMLNYLTHKVFYITYISISRKISYKELYSTSNSMGKLSFEI